MAECVSTGILLMGLPHVGAEYTKGRRNGRRNYERTSDVCAVCDSARSASTHHIVAVGTGGRQSSRTNEVDWAFCGAYDEAFGCEPSTDLTEFEVLTPLIAVCGDGSSGCHGMFESHDLSVEWVWDDADCFILWESGWFLSHGYEPHDERLFEFGCYRILRGGETVRVISHG